MTENQIIAKRMIERGGHFAAHLGEALLRADSSNARKIKKGWPEYWEKFSDKEMEQKGLGKGYVTSRFKE